jgi:hypothetical protein
LTDDIDVEEVNRNSSSCGPGHVEMQRLFFSGPGWIALATACGLKILDMFFNFAIPTPTICRDTEEQKQYELLYGKQLERENESS